MVAITTNYPKDAQKSTLKRRKPIDHMLTVLVGPQEKIYRYKPQTIVKHSSYLRTVLLASLMNPQRGSMILVVRHVSPSDWELMMKLVDSKCNQTLNLYDAGRLRKSFDKYGFTEGIKLCDEVLKARP